MKLTINPKYARLRGFTESLPRIFPTSTGGKTLYEGRNIVKLYTQNGQRITVKSYGHLTLFNRLIYGSLRKSKAERAFRHAIRLQCLGIDTPEAVASLEIRRFGMLRDSYFVSAYTDYLPPFRKTPTRKTCWTSWPGSSSNCTGPAYIIGICISAIFCIDATPGETAAFSSSTRTE